MNQSSSEFNMLSVSAAQSHSKETGRSVASKLLSARAGNDSNSSSDFYLESGRRENTAHICYAFTLLIAALLTAKEISYSLVS